MKNFLQSFGVSLIFIVLFLNFFRPITAINEDLGRHLLLGKIIVQTNTIPQTNLLSYTNPDYPFINSHWLSEVIFFLIHHNSGFDGLLIFTVGISIMTFGIIFLFVNKRYGLPAFLIAASLYLPLLFERNDIRPEIFSYFFTAIFITILYQYRTTFTKLIFLLIPLQILWVNFHIYFFVGLLLLALFLFDQLVTDKFRLTKHTKTLLAIFFLSLIGTIFNPNGVHGAIFPLTVFQNYAFPVTENQNIITLLTIYRQPSIYFFVMASSMLVILLLITRRQTKLIDWLLVIVFTSLTCFAFRNITLFVYTTIIPFTASIAIILPKLLHHFQQLVGKKYYVYLTKYGLFILLLILLAHLANMLSHKPVGLGVTEQGKAAADFFLQNKLSGPVYNNFDSGSYLSYRIYPQKIFIDGRPEAYPKTFIEKVYLPMQQDPKKFVEIDNHYQFTTLFLFHWNQTPWKEPFITKLLDDSQYSLIYLDDYSLIFVKETDQNKQLLQKYAISQETFILPEETSPEALVRYLYFFEKVAWERQKTIVSKRMEKLDPQKRVLKRYRNALQKN